MNHARALSIIRSFVAELSIDELGEIKSQVKSKNYSKAYSNIDFPLEVFLSAFPYRDIPQMKRLENLYRIRKTNGVIRSEACKIVKNLETGKLGVSPGLLGAIERKFLIRLESMVKIEIIKRGNV